VDYFNSGSYGKKQSLRYVKVRSGGHPPILISIE
jgi:hypothetical protein